MRQILVGRLESEEQSLCSHVCVEPAQIAIEGMLPARALSRVDSGTHETSRVTYMSIHSETGAPSRFAYATLASFSNVTLVVPKATVLGVAGSLVDIINPKYKVESHPTVKPDRQRNESLYRKLLRGNLDNLLQDEKQLVESILLKYAHAFHDEDTNDFKCSDVMEHQIWAGDTPPIRRPQYRTPYALRHEIKVQVERMLEKGIIRESNSPWFAPAILGRKKTIDGKRKYRFCVDFRALKAVTKFDPHPLPVFEDSTSTLFGSGCFSN